MDWEQSQQASFLAAEIFDGLRILRMLPLTRGHEVYLAGEHAFMADAVWNLLAVWLSALSGPSPDEVESRLEGTQRELKVLDRASHDRAVKRARATEQLQVRSPEPQGTGLAISWFAATCAMQDVTSWRQAFGRCYRCISFAWFCESEGPKNLS